MHSSSVGGNVTGRNGLPIPARLALVLLMIRWAQKENAMKKRKTSKAKGVRSLPEKALGAKTAKRVKGGVNISNYPLATPPGSEGPGASSPQKP